MYDLEDSVFVFVVIFLLAIGVIFTIAFDLW